MSSEEEDYMSDAFLSQCVKDVKPGLIVSQSEKRSFHNLKRKKEQDDTNRKKNQNTKCKEAEMREEGLNRPLTEDNKGFLMMQKMGYNPGMGIGKSTIGNKEPIPILLKSNRGGLGRERKETCIRKLKVTTSDKMASVSEYRSRFIERAIQKTIGKDLGNGQYTCQILDKSNGIEVPEKLWYWPPKKTPQCSNEDLDNLELKKPDSLYSKHQTSDDDDDDDDDAVMEVDEEEPDKTCDEDIKEDSLSESEKLQILSAYLRVNYHYCIWCGVHYEDDIELQFSCPGDTRELH